VARKGRYGIYKAIILKNNVVGVVNYTLTVDTGFYSLSGQDINLSVGRSISVDTGIYNLTGEDVVFSVGKSISVDTGFYGLTGEDVSFNVGRNIIVDTGFYGLIGNDVSLIFTPFNPPIPTIQDGIGGGSGNRNEQNRLNEEKKRVDDNNLISVFKIFLEQCQ
jgi:hypothetical protein